jgi:hypothetical protein
MPKNKFQGIIFGLIMSYAMAIGMEVYNVAIRMGFNLTEGLGFSSMTNTVFLEALKEAAYMGLIVFVISNLWGNRIGEGFANKYCDIQRDNPYFCRIMRQAGTVAIMCPSMSLIAAILFNVIRGGAPVSQLPAIWVGTVIKNFPMAFFWNMFAATGLTRCIFGILFRAEKEQQVKP